MKKSAVILFTLISLQVLCNFRVALSQQGNVLDSLHYLLESAHNDSEKVRYLVEISRTYEPVDLSRSLRYSEKALELAEKATDRKIEAFAIFNLGNVAFNSGLYEIAAQYFYKYLEIQRELNNTKLIPYAFVNLGSVSLAIANYILGSNPQPFCFENADVNNDGNINVNDMIGTVNIIASGGK